MERSVKKLIGDVEYEITKPLADLGLEFSLQVAKVAVPFIAQLLPALQSGDWSQIADSAGRLVMSLTPADLKYFNETLGGLTQAHNPDGTIKILKRENFVHHFADRYDEWITWLVFGIQTVSGSFLVGALGLGALLKKKSLSGSAAGETVNQKTGSPSGSQNHVNRNG